MVSSVLFSLISHAFPEFRNWHLQHTELSFLSKFKTSIQKGLTRKLGYLLITFCIPLMEIDIKSLWSTDTYCTKTPAYSFPLQLSRFYSKKKKKRDKDVECFEFWSLATHLQPKTDTRLSLPWPKWIKRHTLYTRSKCTIFQLILQYCLPWLPK